MQSALNMETAFPQPGVGRKSLQTCRLNVLQQRTCQDKEFSIPDSHALEHLGTGVERKHGGAANTWTVQETQGQALHEGQRRRLGGAVIDNAGDGRLGQDGIYTDNMAVLQLKHTREEGLCRLE